jgi:hypothetical protein
VYQSPVAQFQTAVNSANDGVRTYLLGVNDVIAKGNLYDKVGTPITSGPDWVASDLASGISMDTIHLRLQALGTISAYANALGAMAESKDVANLGQAAKTLGDNVNSLSMTLAKADPKLDNLAGHLGAPITSLVTLFGTLEIQHAQKAALEKAIIDGSTNQKVQHMINKIAGVADVAAAVDNLLQEAIQLGTTAAKLSVA